MLILIDYIHRHFLQADLARGVVGSCPLARPAAAARPGRTWGEPSASKLILERPSQGTATNPGRDNIFLEQARHFIDCVEGRAASRCTVEEADQTLQTVLAALVSTDNDGRFVDVPQMAMP